MTSLRINLLYNRREGSVGAMIEQNYQAKQESFQSMYLKILYVKQVVLKL